MANHQRIVLSAGTLSYRIAGRGLEKVILFHGAGQHNEVFPILHDETCLQRFTFYSVDLFFHGESEWYTSNKVLEKKIWKMFIHALFDQEKIDKCSLVGFSLGARFALATVECFPQRITRLILLAPDGLRFHLVYRLAVSTFLMRSIFKRVMNHPNAMSFIKQLVHKIGFTTKAIYRQIEKQTDSQEKRIRLYNCWVAFRQLKFQPSELASLIDQYAIPVDICNAKHDLLVSKKAIQQFSKKSGSRYYEIETHHLGVLKECKSILLSSPNGQGGESRP